MLALVQNYLISNQNTGSNRIVPKINVVFYRKGSAEPISLNHYGRSCDVTRFIWCVFLGASLFLRIECLCEPLSSVAPPYLLGLGFHADADAAGTHYLFRICFPHVIAFLFYFSYT